MTTAEPTRRWRPVLALCAGVLVAIGVLFAWLAGSASGLAVSARLAAALSDGRVLLLAPGGRLVGPLHFDRLEFRGEGFTLVAEKVALRWNLRALFSGRLDIERLHADRILYTPLANDERSPPPRELHLPFALDVGALTIGALDYGTVFAARDIAGSLKSDRRRHEVVLTRMQSGEISAEGRLGVDGAAPIVVEASARLATAIEEKPLALALTAKGPLAAIALRVAASGSASGSAEALVTPFAEAPFARAYIALDDLDPAAWAAGAPGARLQIRADLVPLEGGIEGVGGAFSVVNETPGVLDKQRLPIAGLSGRVDWRGGLARLEALRVKLRQGGELSGSGTFQDETLELALNGRDINAAALHTALLPTRLQGRINARVSANAQNVTLNLSDRRFSLIADATRAADRLAVRHVELVSAHSRLSAQGSLALTGAMAFSAAGEMKDFDPARFAKLPAGRINGRFSTSGALSPRLVADASFAFAESRLGGQPFSGKGEVTVDWPLLPKVEVALAAGVNRLTARGAFGRGAGALTINVEAPDLSPYGVEGGVSGDLELAGGIASPRLTARLASPRLGLPGRARLTGVALALTGGAELAAPLSAELSIDRIDTPERAGVVRALRVAADGTTRRQRWQANADLADGRALTFAADGGLQEPLTSDQPPLWRGQLTALRLIASGEGDKAPKQTRLKLDAPAPLTIGASNWALGPAELSGDTPDWRANLVARAETTRVEASLTASGDRIGRIDATASAAMDGAWSLATESPWQARVSASIPDLGWVASLIDENWQSAGRIEGELTLSGTPARPLANGRLRGEQLALRRPEQKLELERGQLDAEIADNRLRLRTLAFDSILQPMPSSLRRSSSDAVRALAARPGRLELSGELELDANRSASNALIDFRLDRVGAWQLPEQWLLLSGSGRLTWRASALAVRGRINADAGYWQLAPAGAPRLSDDVVIMRAGGDKKTSELRPNLDLDLTASLGNSLFFSGAGLSSRLAGEIRLRAQGRDLPRASGTIATRAGRFEAYGQQLSIERGVLTFQGLPDNPALDIRAVRRGLAVEAGVQVGGSAQRPIVRLVSDPELPDSEKLAWLVLGHGSEQMGAGDAATLLSAASGVLGSNSGGVIAQIKRRFGVDELGLRQGQIGDSGRQATSRIATSGVDTPVAGGEQIFIAGKRIATNAVISFEQVLGRADSIVKLTLALSRRVSLIARAGSDNAIDLVYTITLGERPRRPDAAAGEGNRDAGVRRE